jgi:hypothetical protein
VYAKRVPKDAAPPADAAVAAPSETDDDAVREVSWDVPQPKHGSGDPKLPEAGRPDEPDERPDVGALPAAVEDPIPEAVPVIDDGGQPPAAAERGDGKLVRPAKGGRPRRAATVWRHPLDW